MSTTRTAAVLATAATVVAALLTTSAAAPTSSRLAPGNPDPQLFEHPRGNPFYPLTPGWSPT